MSSPSSPPTLNPTTPLAFLPPDLGAQLEASRYLYMATLGAFLWDILSNAPEDWKLITKHHFRLPVLAYFISRVFALAFITTNVVFQIAPVPSCHALQVAIGWCWTVALSSTSFLFYVRAKAVFTGNPWAIAFFTFMWVSNVGASFVVPFAIDGTHIPGTMNCRNSAVQPWSASTVVISACNDTFTLLGISWKLISPQVEGVGGLVKSFIGGRGLRGISKALMLGGQQYYVITVAFNILQMSMILTPTVPPILRAMFSVPNIAITNAMACRVYRNIVFGNIQDIVTLPPPGSSTSKTGPNMPMWGHSGKVKDAYAYSQTKMDAQTGTGVGTVEIMKTVETETDVRSEFRYPPQAYQKAPAPSSEWMP